MLATLTASSLYKSKDLKRLTALKAQRSTVLGVSTTGANKSARGSIIEGGGTAAAGSLNDGDGGAASEVPSETDTSYVAKVARFRLFEARLNDLEQQASQHCAALLESLRSDSAFTEEAVRLVGTEDPSVRLACTAAWARTASALAVAEAYVADAEQLLLAPLRRDQEASKAVHAAMKEREGVDKDFAHYVAKLSELKLKKADAKKTERNQAKYDETMQRLETATESVVGLFTDMEERREALVTGVCVAWLRVQREHLPTLFRAFNDGSSDAHACPVEGLDRATAAEDGDSGKVAVSSSWRTNMKHRLKYGSGADYSATDGEMEALFNTEAALYSAYERAVPLARERAAAFLDKAAACLRLRHEMNETWLGMALLPRGGGDDTRSLADVVRFAKYDAEQRTVGMVRSELEARLEADAEIEERVKATRTKYEKDVLKPLDAANVLFSQPMVLEWAKERPTLVASVNHYSSKIEDLEKAVSDARKLGDPDKARKAVDAAEKKLRGNREKHDAEAAKLEGLTKQLITSFTSTEAKCVACAFDVMGVGTLAHSELLQHVAACAEEIAGQPPLLGAAHSSGPRAWARGKRKERLRKGLGADGKALSLSDLRFEQAAALQADVRRLLCSSKLGALKAKARKAAEKERLRLEAEEKARKRAEAEEKARREAEAERARVAAEEDALFAEASGKYGVGGGNKAEELKRLVLRMEKQEEQLVRTRTALEEAEAARDEYCGSLESATGEVADLSAGLEELKGRYMEQRFMNAKLMLEIQSLKGNIQVCCRIRPFNKTETDRGDEAAVELITETECAVLTNSNTWEAYGFDQVWGQQSSQAQVFEQVEALALSVVEGFNACICCYGQTGSGKTFTMTGLPREGKPGISFQTMDKVFETLEMTAATARANAEAAARAESIAAERRRNKAKGGDREPRPPPPIGSGSKVTAFEWRAAVSMLEIYNEEVRCLLSPPPSKHEAPAKLDIKQGANGLMTVPGLVAQPVATTEDVLDAFEQGNATRSVASTAMNATSSRSHMVLMVDVTTRTNEGAETTGRLYLVDLAGSERVAKSGVTGQAMKEAQGINKSLSALGDVMESLDKNTGHIPYRNSKLTFLLQSALGGTARCMFIFNASPADGNSEETRCTFKFASRMRNISLGAAKKNVDMSGLEDALAKAKAEARSSAAEAAALRRELAAAAKDSDKTKGAAGKGSAKDVVELERKLATRDAKLSGVQGENASLKEQLQSAEKQIGDLKRAAFFAEKAAKSADKAAPAKSSAPARGKSPPPGRGSTLKKQARFAAETEVREIHGGDDDDGDGCGCALHVGDRLEVRDAGEDWELGTIEGFEHGEPLVRKDGWDVGDAYVWAEHREATREALSAADEEDPDIAAAEAALVALDAEAAALRASGDEVDAPSPSREGGGRGGGRSGGGRGSGRASPPRGASPPPSKFAARLAARARSGL